MGSYFFVIYAINALTAIYVIYIIYAINAHTAISLQFMLLVSALYALCAI